MMNDEELIGALQRCTAELHMASQTTDLHVMFDHLGEAGGEIVAAMQAGSSPPDLLRAINAVIAKLRLAVKAAHYQTPPDAESSPTS